MSHCFRIVMRTGLLVGTLLAGSVQAFQADGFWTGMSPQQLLATATAYGLVAQPGKAGRWLISTKYPLMVIAEAGFCQNHLVSYRRNIQSDEDYANTLSGIFAIYGPPRKMSFSGDVATGTSEGAFRASGETLWAQGPDRVRMESFFDWRMNQGDLRRQQPASVLFETRNPCANY
jgi:hypothetical protein